jgi:hypothetical protein
MLSETGKTIFIEIPHFHTEDLITMWGREFYFQTPFSANTTAPR